MRLFFSALMLCLSTMLSATTLNSVVVFGDSLSDNGNLYEYMKHNFPMHPPYYQGRFSNGPVWAELLVKSYYPQDESLSHLIDYAYGGAAVVNDDDEDTLFTLHNQVKSYFLSHQDHADPKSLYVIWIGANNYLALPDVNDMDATVQEVNNGIKQTIQELVEKGAKTILVANLPDLGRTPAAKMFEAASDLTEYSNRHNEQLAKTVEELKKAHPSVQLIHFDVKTALDEMLSNPEQYGFKNVTDTCYESLVDAPSINTGLLIAAHIKVRAHLSPCDGYMFFDPVHPSALAHQIMADKTKELLQNTGVQFE